MLTADETTSFQNNGFAVLGPALKSGELPALNAAAAELLGLDGSPSSLPEDHLMRAGAQGHVRVALHVCHRSEAFRAQALDPGISSAMAELFGREAAVLTSLLFHKPPRVGEPLEPHQDLPYYPYLGPESLITSWTALTEASEANGCVHYLAQSHRGQIDHRDTGGQQALDIDPAMLEEFADVAVPLAPGESCVHHGLTVHYSGANHTAWPRIGVAVLYVPADAGVTLDDFPYPLLHPGRT
ncbi:MAG TPA: phytanoyl-CoA dioxygenase family protein [Actinospica sp.]|nr:phytanoyl-CoA dioxygenase family protein [Actinospica sp.]